MCHGAVEKSGDNFMVSVSPFTFTWVLGFNYGCRLAQHTLYLLSHLTGSVVTIPKQVSGSFNFYFNKLDLFTFINNVLFPLFLFCMCT